MKRIWVVIDTFLLGMAVRAWAGPVQGVPAVAAHEVSTEAEAWVAAKKADKPTMALEAAQEKKPATETSAAPPEQSTPVAAPAPPPAAAPAKPIVRQTGLNEMKGKLLSISFDPRTLRLIAGAGFNVEFTYDPKTSVIEGNNELHFEDLIYNDEIVVRYSGKDLRAVEIERITKAPRVE